MPPAKNNVNYGQTRLTNRAYRDQFSFDDPSTWRRADWINVARGDQRYAAYWSDNPYNYNSSFVNNLAGGGYDERALNTRQELLEAYEHDYNSEASESQRLKAVGINPDLQGLDQATNNSMSGNSHSNPAEGTYRRYQMGLDAIGQSLEAIKTGASIYSTVTDTDIKKEQMDMQRFNTTANQILDTGSSYTPTSKRNQRKQFKSWQDLTSSGEFHKALWSESTKRKNELDSQLIRSGFTDQYTRERLIDDAIFEKDVYNFGLDCQAAKYNYEHGYYSALNPRKAASAFNAKNGYDSDYYLTADGSLAAESANSDLQSNLDYNASYNGTSQAEHDQRMAALQETALRQSNDTAKSEGEYRADQADYQKDMLALFKEKTEPILKNIDICIKNGNEVSLRNLQRRLRRYRDAYLQNGGSGSVDKDYMQNIERVLKIGAKLIK